MSILFDLLPFAIMAAVTVPATIKAWRGEYDIKVTDAQGRTVYMRSSELDTSVIDGGELRSYTPEELTVEQIANMIIEDYKQNPKEWTFHSRDNLYHHNHSFFYGIVNEKKKLKLIGTHVRVLHPDAFYVDDIPVKAAFFDKYFARIQAATASIKLQETAAKIQKLKPAPPPAIRNMSEKAQLGYQKIKEASTKSDIVDPFRSNLERPHNHNWHGHSYNGKRISKVERIYEAYGDTHFYKISFQDGSAELTLEEIFELQLGNSAGW